MNTRLRIEYISVIFLALLIPLNLFAQVNATDYNFIVKKELVFQDDFENNKNTWLDKWGESFEFDKHRFIKSGIFVYKNNKRGYKALACKVSFDYSKNFEIEIKAKITVTKKEGQSGILFWAREQSPNYQANYFYINPNGTINIFTIIKDSNNKERRVKDTIVDIAGKINPLEYNIYTIRHYNGLYYIFANERFVTEQPYIAISGDFIGLGASKGAQAEFDYIRMYYIE